MHTTTTTTTLLLSLSTLAFSLPAPQQQQLPFSPPATSPLLLLKPTSFTGLPTLSSFSSLLPHCTLSALTTQIESEPQLRLLQFGENEQPVEVKEGEKALLKMKGIKFMDVTDHTEDQGLRLVGSTQKAAFPTKLSYNTKQLDPLFNQLDIKQMKTFLTKFSSFRTRYYKSETGKESQAFLLNHLKSIASTNPKLNISITEFPHPWGQNSIIVHFAPLKHTTSQDIVILGAHQDSYNFFSWLPAPGADDDGSGTTTLQATFKALVNASFVPSLHPVELHFYSAEEGGLLGSQAVAQSYAKQGKGVRAMLQQDMTAFVKPGTTPTVGIIRDYVDSDFTDLVALIVDEYAEISRTDTSCGYACSDHASWSKIGAPSAFAIESTFPESNKKIHSSGDTIQQEGFSFEHIKQFTRISIAMAVELGGGKSLGFK